MERQLQPEIRPVEVNIPLQPEEEIRDNKTDTEELEKTIANIKTGKMSGENNVDPKCSNTWERNEWNGYIQ